MLPVPVLAAVAAAIFILGVATGIVLRILWPLLVIFLAGVLAGAALVVVALARLGMIVVRPVELDLSALVAKIVSLGWELLLAIGVGLVIFVPGLVLGFLLGSRLKTYVAVGG